MLRARELQVFSERLDRFRGMLGPQDSSAKRAAVEEFGWMIEEFKVSLFAQELKTVVPVSPKRLDRLAREIDRMA